MSECKTGAENQPPLPQLSRVCLTIRGAVQGVGFRPFVYRLATELKLTGWVNNSARGVFIEVEGMPQQLETFCQRLAAEKPALSFIQNLEVSWQDPVGYIEFEIRASVSGEKTAVVLPDIATCPDCLQEIFDRQNRRYRYPFTNCTNCGPRYTIIAGLPYDRGQTTMKHFHMCPECQQEYDNPLNRRFHAQPNACPQCGPHLELWDNTGKSLAEGDRALHSTVTALCQGKIVAVKGLGGFHLMVNAGDDRAVQRLRQCKGREEKPFALMSPGLDWVRRVCEVSPPEERVLRSPACPIVLLRRHAIADPAIAPAVAPGNPYLGIMLPYTPLHHLLLADFGQAVVATSGNLSDEPICTDEGEAIARLGNIADLFLVHNRPIVRPIDDSVVRVVGGREMVMRRARGYAPLPISANYTSPPVDMSRGKAEKNLPKILGVGAHLKNTIAIGVGEQMFVSQHIGDLETPQACASFERAIASLQDLYDAQPQVVARDAHPDYRSTQFAATLHLPVISVQHHYAHVLACMAENQILGESVLGVAWDGTGYGLDGTIWGGEFLRVCPSSWERVGHFRTFRLPGGDKAVKEPRRVALGLLYEVFGEAVFGERSILDELPHLRDAFTPSELKLLQQMFQRQLNVPLTSSAGRLFDGVAAIAGVRQTLSFEGQAAMGLEFALEGADLDEGYPVELHRDEAGSPVVFDWGPMVVQIVRDLGDRLPVGAISAKFHNTLVEAIAAVAQAVGEERIVLTGGCFQNAYLSDRAIRRLRATQLRPYWHQRIPPNDGGIALGQIVAASRAIASQSQYKQLQQRSMDLCV